MHHEITLFYVVGLGDDVGDYGGVFRQKCLVIDFLPLKALVEKGRNLTGSGIDWWCCLVHLIFYPREAKVLEMQAADEVEIAVCKSLKSIIFE